MPDGPTATGSRPCSPTTPSGGQTARAQDVHGHTEDEASLITTPDSLHTGTGGQTVPGDGQTTSPGSSTSSSCRAGTDSGNNGTSSPAAMEEDTDDDLLDYEPSPAHDDMEIRT
jgi:hypothetical protein